MDQSNCCAVWLWRHRSWLCNTVLCYSRAAEPSELALCRYLASAGFGPWRSWWHSAAHLSAPGLGGPTSRGGIGTYASLRSSRAGVTWAARAEVVLHIRLSQRGPGKATGVHSATLRTPHSSLLPTPRSVSFHYSFLRKIFCDFVRIW